MKRLAASVFVGLVIVASAAGASPPTAVAPAAPRRASATEPVISPWIYLNRCVGGCTVHESGLDDARAQASSIPCSGTVTCSGGGCYCSAHGTASFTIHEFTDSNGQIGSAADADWAAVMHCVREVYSPFNITVTDQLPPGGVGYNEGIVAGNPSDIGYGMAGVGGIAPGGCDAHDDAVSFTFANIYTGAGRAAEICAVAAQETAHAYGLEHVYEYPDHSSACNDPMTYRPACGQQFFRNEGATCGEFAPRACACGGFQNDHLRIKALFGPGTPITEPPHITIVTPTAGPIANGVTVQASGSSQRGIAKLELWLNNFMWVQKTYTPQGTQPDAAYPLALPANVPDGVIDIVVKAYDDIAVETDSATVTVTKGAPCTSAASCATGQKCDAGKCYWDPPTGQLGDACTYAQYCVSNVCQGTTEKQICTQACIVGVSDSCPTGYDCIQTQGTDGVCFPVEPAAAGCCSAAGHDSAWLHGGLSLAVLGLVLRRRRRT